MEGVRGRERGRERGGGERERERERERSSSLLCIEHTIVFTVCLYSISCAFL